MDENLKRLCIYVRGIYFTSSGLYAFQTPRFWFLCIQGNTIYQEEASWRQRN